MRTAAALWLITACLVASVSEGKKKSMAGCKSSKSPVEFIKRSNNLLSQGKTQLALSCLLDAVAKFPSSGECWESLGAVYADAGYSEEGQNALRKALAIDPALGLAALKLGNILAAQGLEEDAIEMFERASEARPDSPIPFNNIGLSYMRQRKREQAVRIFQEGLDSTAANAYGRGMILNNLGLVLKDAGHLEEAIRHFEEARALDGSLESHANLANALFDVGQYGEAEQMCRDAMEGNLRDKNILVVYLSSLVLQDKLHSVVELLSSDSFARSVGSDKAEILQLSMLGALSSANMIGAARLLTQAHERYELNYALRAYVTALRIEGDSKSSMEQQQALSGLGALLYRLARFGDSEKIFRRITRLKSVDRVLMVEAYNGLGASIEMSHTRLDEAVRFYRTSYEMNNDFETPFFSLIHLLGRICDWRGWERDFSKARALIDQGTAGGLGPIFALAYPLSDRQLCNVVRQRAAHVLEVSRRISANFIPWLPDKSAGVDKLAIAFLSADFNARPVGQLVQGLFRFLDRSRLEVFCFSFEANDGSEPLVTIHNSVDEFHWVKGIDSRMVAEMVNSAQAHVMVELNGYTDGGHAEIGALRPAPVVVHYLGYPYSLGLPQFDFIITDRVVTPPEHHPSCFTEKFAVLPRTYMVADHRQSQMKQVEGDFTPEDAAARNLPHHQHQVIFANFNHLQKLGPGTFALWMKILGQVPSSLLWMLRFPREAEAHLKREAAASNINASRILMTDKILLDTLEYNAHVSGIDALWIGLPLITLAGSNMARRCGASFLQSQGLDLLLARTQATSHVLHPRTCDGSAEQEEYVEMAVKLGRSTERGGNGTSSLRKLRQRVEGARSSSLFDTEAWVRDFERLVHMMVEAAWAGGDGRGRNHLVASGYSGWKSSPSAQRRS
ncbi:hypothetical protein GUITHDRAFT_107237 [Guillardia theta CCMP2712]|uniref:protein O-GlcNAc transferase n=1 Tax=Guillardia theta (strain CCMP2712) TaxID=905079 RepID=L1JEH2_GUITC|nr:hypothetical protein GUITHDRAFT_107237 [Guillardia theta CCMP2712]EKX46881.1 hypothetical protein GUITHDRAFT_107237 [Guillardia theta CCMP2712]|eukprot:XP_005833861.1 hypothetical protein GUITHDRAFT_107237 [Guillardia theta CCMP2712]